MAIDPVCKMEVDEKTAKFDNTSTRARHTTSVHRGARRRMRRTRKSTYENSSLKTKNPPLVTDGLNVGIRFNTRKGKKDTNTIEDVYWTMMNGGEIQKQIERIRGHII